MRDRDRLTVTASETRSGRTPYLMLLTGHTTPQNGVTEYEPQDNGDRLRNPLRQDPVPDSCLLGHHPPNGLDALTGDRLTVTASETRSGRTPYLMVLPVTPVAALGIEQRTTRRRQRAPGRRSSLQAFVDHRLNNKYFALCRTGPLGLLLGSGTKPSIRRRMRQ